jgi:hypothetical protein
MLVSKKYTFITICFLVFTGVLLYKPVWADANSSSTAGKNSSISADIKNLIAGYGTSKNSQKALVAAPSDTLIVPEGNVQALYLPTPTNPLAITQTLQSLTSYFTAYPRQTAASNNMNNDNATFGSASIALPSLSNLYTNCAQNSSNLPPGQTQNNGIGCPQGPIASAFTNVDLNSLLGPLVYQGGQAQAATNFIQAASNMAKPLKLVDLNKLAANNNTTVAAMETSNPHVIQYVNDLKNYVAIQAAAVSNLYQLYAERVPTSVSAKSNPSLYQALNAIGMPNASQLQVENYMTSRRIIDPQWVANLSKDGPAALLRQMVVLLAENLTESYNNRLATERLTATMSLLALEQTNALQQQLQQDADYFSQSMQKANTSS